MIPVVEDILSEVIEARLKWLNSNIDIVDRIFKKASVTSRNRLKSYIGKNGISVLRGFPVDRATLPAYVIMLGGEVEVSQTIGDYFGEDEDSTSTEHTSETQKIRKQGNSHIINVVNKPLYEVSSISYGGRQYYNEFEVLDSQHGTIRILFPVDLQTEDTVTIDYTFSVTGVDVYGTYYQSQYRVETWTSNGDLTILLYHLLKWMLLSSREYLAEMGLVVQSLGGLDFEPAPEYFPEFVFRRALTFECTTENSYETEFSYIKSVDVEGKLTDVGSYIEGGD